MLICCITLLSYLLLLDYALHFWAFSTISLVLLKGYMGYYDGLFYSDFLSFSMILISIWIFFLSIMAMKMSTPNNLLLWWMMYLILLSFFVFNGLLFYLLFEFSFTIMFLFLLKCGVMMERVQASLYMLFYTLVFSLPFLVMILESMKSSTMTYFLLFKVNTFDFLWITMIFMFLVKLPLFGVHLWLPKAHVEAPVSGSMLLAGVLLKLGGYGLIRFYGTIEFLSIKNNLLLVYFFYISFFGGLVLNFLCMRQTDLKMFIAYSSIVHMSLVYVGIFSFSLTSNLGTILMMMAHGFISPSMFFLMNMLYMNSYSRSMFSLKGNLVLAPLFSMVWFMSCALNFGFPPFMSFFSEIYIVMSVSFLSLPDIALLIAMFFFTGTYCIFMYISVSHGKPIFSPYLKMSLKTLLTSTSHFSYVLLFPFFFIILSQPMMFFKNLLCPHLYSSLYSFLRPSNPINSFNYKFY